MDASPLRESGAALALASDLGAKYISGIPDRHVAPSKDDLTALKAFDEPMPNSPQTVEGTLRKLDTFGSPATVASTGGRFFGLVVGGTLPATLGARVLTSTWDQIVFNDATSPVGVKLEAVASRWLLEILGLPRQSSVGFTTGATMANFTCLAGARHALLARQGWDISKRGLQGSPPLRIIASEQIHVTAIKALTLLGFGTEQIEYVPCDAQGRVIARTMPKLDSSCLVLLQAGNLNSGAFDPIGEIAANAAESGAWIHVDGAFGLWAAASDKTAGQLAAYDRADSWVVDGHKWLNTPYDCGIAITKSPEPVHMAMATQAPYLKVGGTVAPKDMVPEFSRSTRGVEVWAALRSLGKSGVAELIDRCCSHARLFAAGLEGIGFEILNDVVLNQVVASWPDNETLAPRIAKHVQDSGTAWFGPTTWQGRQAIRISVASWATTVRDVTETLSAVRRAVFELTEDL
ncbi:MAG: pyridoxal-dependent decarboxylase [Hyphomonadaceae bacterium BRH_c29]|nr:MAG: pyridoxal-dependent decarboxylase [Hyphomonadaceae bacterium BRH_c29]